MPAITHHDSAQPDRGDALLYEALVRERYGRPLHEILWEETKHPLPELLKERHRRPRLAAVSTPPQRQPDPDAAAHCSVLLEASAPRRRSTAA